MKGLKFYMITGVILVSVIGTLLHFAYECSGNNVLVGLFTPVNESVWEHTKLIFFPMTIYSLQVRKKAKKEYPCINSAMIFGSLFGILLIIALFYTYSGIIGFNIAIVDIAIFYISVIISFYAVYKLTLSCNADKYSDLLRILQIITISMFFIFSYYPPQIPIFVNP